MVKVHSPETQGGVITQTRPNLTPSGRKAGPQRKALPIPPLMNPGNLITFLRQQM